MAAADAELFVELAALLADDFVDVEVLVPLFAEVFDDDVADFDSVVELEALPFDEVVDALSFDVAAADALPVDDEVADEVEAAAELEALSLEAEADDAAVDEAAADALADVVEELVAEAAVELDALCEEPSTSGTCTLGSNGCGMNNGTTYKAKSAIIANTPTVPSTLGIFDFLTGGAASPRFCDDECTLGWWDSFSLSAAAATACTLATAFSGETGIVPPPSHDESTVSPATAGASMSRTMASTALATCWAASDAFTACPQLGQNRTPSSSFDSHSSQYAISASFP